MITINATDWYWKIATNPAAVYSSKRNVYVDPATDSAFTTWQTAHGGVAAVPVPTEGDVWVYVQSFLPLWLWNGTVMSQPAVGQYTKAQLTAYSADARYRKATGGCTITGKAYLTDPTARNTVSSAHLYAVNNPGHITDWKLADGTFTQLTAAQLANVEQQMATFVQACYSCESANETAISSGTMTSITQIDSAFAAISNTLA
jgi:hypothetical protein